MKKGLKLSLVKNIVTIPGALAGVGSIDLMKKGLKPEVRGLGKLTFQRFQLEA